MINNFGYLKLNICSSNIVNFLDLNISLNAITGKLNFSIYIKPTNTFSYLLTSSNHPNFIFKNIPKSLFIRLRRICSNLYDYFYFARKLLFELIQRGYDFDTLLKIIRMVANLDRNKILIYKEKDIKFSDKNILFISNYDLNGKQLHNSISNNLYKVFKDENNYFSSYSFNLVHSVQPNLSSIFIHDFKPSFSSKHFYKKCLKKKMFYLFFFSSEFVFFIK